MQRGEGQGDSSTPNKACSSFATAVQDGLVSAVHTQLWLLSVKATLHMTLIPDHLAHLVPACDMEPAPPKTQCRAVPPQPGGSAIGYVCQGVRLALLATLRMCVRLLTMRCYSLAAG